VLFKAAYFLLFSAIKAGLMKKTPATPTSFKIIRGIAAVV
jgi:hypothetical protein